MSQKPYPIPPFPSPHLSCVLDYIKCLESFEFVGLSKLTTPYFTQQTLPASLDLPVRSKTEDLEYLETVKESVGGANLDVCSTQICFSLVFDELTKSEDHHIRYR
jgi:hypothetical protein